MQVTLIHNTPLSVLKTAIRTCWDSHCKSDDMGDMDLKLIDRVCNEYRHQSVMEHIVYTFDIRDIPRFVLQELVRHRIASYSVKSTRYTLKELKNEEPFIGAECLDRAKKFIYLSDNPVISAVSTIQLETLRQTMSMSKVSNDTIKPLVPECYLTNLVMTINARSLLNLLSLRLGKQALKEIRDLSKLILDAIPNDHHILFKNILLLNEGAKDVEKDMGIITP